MRIRLTKPLAQPSLMKVIPAGIIIDAPNSLSERLLRQNKCIPVLDGEAPRSAKMTRKNDASRGNPSQRKVKRNG